VEGRIVRVLMQPELLEKRSALLPVSEFLLLPGLRRFRFLEY
jgi:hypothetical protein